MSCPQMGDVYTAMTNNMRMKMGGYVMSLQSRYGDPRVYAQQEEQMRRDQAAVAYNKSKKTAALLEDAYKRQTERNRSLHSDRLKTRHGRRSASRPESGARSQPQTSQQELAEPAPSRQARFSGP